MHSAARKIATSVGALLLLVGAASAGAPLKGVGVSLGKSPGGTVASRMTDAAGGFSFGVLAKGNYRLTFSFPAGVVREAGVAEVAVTGAAGGPLESKLVLPKPGSAATRISGVSTIDFRSDGMHPVRGSVQLASGGAGANDHSTHMAVKGAGVSGGSILTGGSAGPEKPGCVPYPGRPCP